MHASKKHRAHSRFLRLLYYRLIVPLKRITDQPEILARGVFVGLLVGFTPTVGIQMNIVLIFWLVCRYIKPLHFNFILAIAWTWVSNPFTMVPMYFVFYLTGKLMLMEYDSIIDFDVFYSGFVMESTGDGFLGAIDHAKAFLVQLWDQFGLGMVIGWIPYSIIFAFLGRYLTLRMIATHKMHNRQRLTDFRNADD